MIKIPFFDLKREVAKYLDEYLLKLSSVLESGSFILGDEVSSFEESFAKFNGMKY
jgi:dTDP-4-amino-4,6-dideoxygalactose transaminase